MNKKEQAKCIVCRRPFEINSAIHSGRRKTGRRKDSVTCGRREQKIKASCSAFYGRVSTRVKNN